MARAPRLLIAESTRTTSNFRPAPGSGGGQRAAGSGQSGSGYPEVRSAWQGVIQHALGCARPEGLSEVHLTFELLVGCDGLVSKVDAVDKGGAPDDYVACVASVIAKADFPAHDREDGQLVTYPVNVAW